MPTIDRKNPRMILLFVISIVFLALAAQVVFTIYSFANSPSLIENPHTGIFTRGKEGNTLYKILIDGDSVGAGIGTSDFDSSLAGLITKHYSGDYFVTTVNQSVSGSKMEDLIDRKVDGKFDLAILIISSNDLFRFTDLESFKKAVPKVVHKYEGIAEKVIFVGPGRVYDATAIPLFARPVYKYFAPKYSDVLRNGVREFENIHLASPIDSLIPIDNYGHTLAKDNFHPNDSGVRYWFDIIKPFLDK